MTGLGHNSASFGEGLGEHAEGVLSDDHKKLFHFVQWHLADYITGTQGMSPEHEGIYMRFLVRLYDRGKPFPDDDRFMSAMLSLDVRRWRRIKADLLSFGKITLRAGQLTNARFEKERLKRADEIRRQAEATHRYWEKKRAEKKASGQSPVEVGAKSDGSRGEVPAKVAEKVNEINRTAEVPTLHTRDQSLYRRDSDPYGSGAEAPPRDDLPDAKDILWRDGLDWLAKASGKRKDALRSLIGRWLKEVPAAELLDFLRAAAKAKTGDPISYVTGIVEQHARSAHSVRRENGRLVAMNGFKTELEGILAGRDLQRALDQIGAKIPIAVSGLELEAKVRGLAVEMVERVAEQDRRYAAAVAQNAREGPPTSWAEKREQSANAWLFADLDDRRGRGPAQPRTEEIEW